MGDSEEENDVRPGREDEAEEERRLKEADTLPEEEPMNEEINEKHGEEEEEEPSRPLGEQHGEGLLDEPPKEQRREILATMLADYEEEDPRHEDQGAGHRDIEPTVMTDEL